jgi:small conductance mechanosensitive channel
MEQVVTTIYGYLATYGLRFIAAILILVIGLWLARLIARLIGTAVAKTGVDKTIVSFVRNLCYVALMLFVIIAALSKLGIQTASFVVVLGAAGLAIGLAMQGSLANFAAGILLLIFKPFKVGDFVETAGQKGTIKNIQIFNTILDTVDNIRVVIPNAKVTAESICNYTTNGTRRVDLTIGVLTIGVSYGDDLRKARHLIEDTLASDDRILKDPPAKVAVCELAENSVNFAVRPWVRCENYWNVYFDTTERIKFAFDENGISIPFPQRDIHVKDGRVLEAVGARSERAHH